MFQLVFSFFRLQIVVRAKTSVRITPSMTISTIPPFYYQVLTYAWSSIFFQNFSIRRELFILLLLLVMVRVENGLADNNYSGFRPLGSSCSVHRICIQLNFDRWIIIINIWWGKMVLNIEWLWWDVHHLDVFENGYTITETSWPKYNL